MLKIYIYLNMKKHLLSEIIEKAKREYYHQIHGEGCYIELLKDLRNISDTANIIDNINKCKYDHNE